jgi:uncharacterized OB-fold protein
MRVSYLEMLMKICPNCGSALSESDRACPSCGAKVAPIEPEPVEKLAIETFIISEKGFSIRVFNSGTKPLIIARISFNNRDTRITGISSGKGTMREGRISMEPGDRADVTVELSSEQLSGRAYPVEVVTDAGNRCTTQVDWP